MPSSERFLYHQVESPHDSSSQLPSHRAEVLARLEAAVGEIQDSDTFRRYLDLQSRFHRYSWSNTLLILQQFPQATRVAGYNTWLKLHRYVRRGEHGIRIIVPMHRKQKVESEDGQETEVDRLFFGVGSVFDYSQTDGEPLDGVDVPILEGEAGSKLYDRLEALAGRESVVVRRGSDDEFWESAMGFYHPAKREIVVREAPMLQSTKTLAHELAHHFTLGEFAERTAAEHESIAESVAYVVCAHFGLDTGARSFPYVALWSRETGMLKHVLSVVQRVSARIIDGVESSASGGKPDTPVGY